MKRKYPQEMSLMNDCPNCGQEVNRAFVEKVIDDIIGLERRNTLTEALAKLESAGDAKTARYFIKEMLLKDYPHH